MGAGKGRERSPIAGASGGAREKKGREGETSGHRRAGARLFFVVKREAAGRTYQQKGGGGAGGDGEEGWGVT